LRLLRQAEAELEHVADEYPEAAIAVEQAIEVIHAAPHRWPKLDRRHHRFVLRRFPYNIVYRFNDAEVIIVAVAQQRRRPGYWVRRR
jgi:hypothetical protein